MSDASFVPAYEILDNSCRPCKKFERLFSSRKKYYIGRVNRSAICAHSNAKLGSYSSKIMLADSRNKLSIFHNENFSQIPKATENELEANLSTDLST